MLAEVQGAAVEAARANPFLNAGIIGLMVTNSFMLLRDALKNRAERQKARAAADEAEAKALKAQADALLAGKAGQLPANGNGHAQYVVPHTAMLERHDAELKAMDTQFKRFERDNREDHGKIFDGINEVKNLILGRRVGG